MNWIKFLLAKIDKLSWLPVVILALTLGLAPFTPAPHIWEKLLMLWNGSLVKPVDWFDLLMHAAPFFLLIIKVLVTFLPRTFKEPSQ